MIDEEKTLELFGYISKELKPQSNRKVWRVCDGCKVERSIEYRKYVNLCFKCSDKTKGRNHYMYGKYHTEETKKKMSNSSKGAKNAMYGKHHSEESKRLISRENNPNWKGGPKLSKFRENVKRRELFGFIPHNIPHKDFHGHHLDFNHVIFIPKELHMSVSHSVINDENMDAINDVVCNWYLEYQIIE